MSVIEGPGKEAEPEGVSANRKLELWGYNANLILKDGENMDMDLLNENRSFIHAGKFLQRSRFKWKELFALLFDNYLVLTIREQEGGVTKYKIYQRPIPLDILTLGNFTDPPIQRGCRLSSPMHEARIIYPCTIHHNGRFGSFYTLFVESDQSRLEWKMKLEGAIGQRRLVQKANEVFDVKTLSADTSFTPSHMADAGLSCSDDGGFTGKVTCSVPFDAPDGRSLVVIGCEEGVWVGLRHDSRFVRVLQLRKVTQCAILEDFGFFLVLASKVLYAYRIEVLVPSSPEATSASQTSRMLSKGNDVEFFASGNVNGRTLVIYVRNKSYNSVFRVLEPVTEKMNESVMAQPGSVFLLWSQRHQWFRVYRDFFLGDESYDLLFLKARVVILCSKGFEFMDLSERKTVGIPQKNDSRLKKLAKRIRSRRPVGMFKLKKDEFLLCYDEFGLYIDNHGDPSRTGTVEWEGTAERVVGYPPYILLFNRRFIEIRHAQSGSLIQIISGNNIRCTWDGRGINQSQPIAEGSEDDMVPHEPRVHGVMDMEEPQSDRGVATTQHVFELVPTHPLYPPGSLGPPYRPSYIKQSNTSPLSPKVDPEHAIR